VSPNEYYKIKRMSIKKCFQSNFSEGNKIEIATPGIA